VKYIPLLAFVLLAGCETTPHSEERGKYTKLTVTDLAGDPVSEWIAEGHVSPVEQGYQIRAVERKTAPPQSMAMRYPNGRTATVAGQNIILEEVPKPDWLKKLDDEAR
jgi:hypothetical protein